MGLACSPCSLNITGTTIICQFYRLAIASTDLCELFNCINFADVALDDVGAASV